MATIIGKGAEAVIYRNENVVKDRIRKNYRIKEIDERLRKTRTRKEAKILEKLAEISFPAPRLIKSDDVKMLVEMEFLSGEKLRDALDKGNCKKLCFEIGKKIAILHNNSIIHGDLTTSNMILGREIYFIDFGLSFTSEKIEDMAVDLHLLKQAFESRHFRIADEAYKSALAGYKKESNYANDVIKRLEVVEGRGRNKGKG